MKIIDDCVNKFFADEIETVFLDTNTFWWYDPNTLGKGISYDTNKFSDTFQFVHPIIDNGRADSPYTSLILKLVNEVLETQSINVLNYRRIKVNQLLKCDRGFNPHPPHVDDSADNMISMIYYINDCDGPTYFFDKNYKIVNSVTPKKNRCVIFASNLLHSSSSPVLNPRRLVVNAVVSTASSVNL